MTDLSDFGVDVDVDDAGDGQGEEETSWEPGTGGGSYGTGREYRNPRCRAIKTDGSARCRSPSHALKDGLCHNHDMARDPVTIDSPPRELVEWTTRSEIDELPAPVRAALEAVDAQEAAG